ncbi:MAG: AAA family ATPase [Chloroflexota bacterium]
MCDLQILLLGPPEIRWKGELLAIQRRIPRSVLFYLAASEGMIARDELLMLFWDDAPSEQARRARLRETLSRLRQTLPDENVIVTNNDLVGLDFKRVFVDQVKFKRILDEIGQLPWKIPVSDPLPESVYRNLLDAANLWRGDTYLAGSNFAGSCELDDWLMRTSENHQNLRKRVFERLSHHALAVGDIEQALRHTQQALESDQLDETLHARVLEILIASNQIERARSYYARTEALLTQELGALPGEQLAEICQRLNLPSRDKGITIPRNWHVRQSLETPFIGRQQPLAQLWRCYQKNTNVFLSGETGIGKTRLLQEFLRRQKPSSYLLVHRCTPGGQHTPFQSTLDAEAEYGTIRKNIDKIPAVYAREILRLIPSLSESRPELLGGVEQAPLTTWQMVLEACRHYLLAVTEGQHVLFVIEDVQWLDTATAEALDYVLSRPPFGTKAMLILTGRSEECLPAVDKHIQTWLAADLMVHIKLERLNLGEVYNLASTVLPEPPPPQFVEQLAAETGSNPFFIVETLREAMQQAPGPDVSKALPLPISSKLAILIHSRLENLSPTARKTFEVAAIIGSEFSPAIVQMVLAVDGQHFEQALTELEQGSLIEVSTDTSEICYRFIHEKFREVVLSDLKPTRKQAVHQQVAGALLAVYGEKTPYPILAQHTELAGDRVKAFEYWVLAGTEACQANKLHKADEWFSKAADLIEPDGNLFTPEAIYRLYRPWLNALIASNNHEACQVGCNRMLDLGQRCGSSLLIGAALSTQTWLHMYRFELEPGLHTARQALNYLEQVGDEFERVHARNVYAGLLYLVDRIEESMQVFQEALKIAQSVEKPSPELLNAQSYTHENIALVYEMRGRPASSRQHAQKALSGAIETQSMLGQVNAYAHLAFACYYLGDYAQARMYNDFGFRIAELTAYAQVLGFNYMYYSWIDLAVGNVSSSLRHAVSALAKGKECGQPLLIGMAERCLADICLNIHQPALALQYYENALACFPRGIAYQDLQWRIGLSNLALGQVRQATDVFQQAIAYAKATGADLITLSSQIGYARLLFEQNDSDRASLLAESVQTEAEQRSLAQLQTEAELLLGEIAHQTHAFDVARGYFESVSERATLRGYALQEIRARTSLARVLVGQNRPIDAQEQRIRLLLDQIAGSISAEDKLPSGESLKELFKIYQESVKLP